MISEQYQAAICMGEEVKKLKTDITYLRNSLRSRSKYYGLDNLLDKKHRLGIHTNYMRKNGNFMRVPKQDNNPTSDCLAGSIKQYLKKTAPG